jgi:hypothetical protein
MCLFARHLEQIPRYKFGNRQLQLHFGEQSSSEEDWRIKIRNIFLMNNNSLVYFNHERFS